MTEGICQVPKEIGTAPEHNPNQDYSVIGDEETVFCEDEQAQLPISDCELIGRVWYSKEFLRQFNLQYEELFEEIEELGSIQADFFVNGRYDERKAKRYFQFIGLSLKQLSKMFQAVGMEAEHVERTG